MLPLVSTLALHPSQRLKAWAQHALSQLQPPTLSTDTSRQSQHAQQAQHAMSQLQPPALSTDSISQSQHAQQAKHGTPNMAFHGAPALLQQAMHQLQAMNRWSHQQDAPPQHQSHQNGSHLPEQQSVLSPMSWLSALTNAFKQARAAGLESASDGDSSQQDEVMKMILIGLLDHPEPCVQAAAASACGEAVQTFPLAGISFLPLLMYKLRRSSTEGTKHSKFTSY